MEKTASTDYSTSICFPPDLYKWMKNNAAPKMALKLMIVCKYFQHKDGFPYFVVKDVDSCALIYDFWTFVTLDNQKEYTFNFKNLEKKLWITGEYLCITSPQSVSTFLLKTVVCNIRKLRLDDQIITFDQFKLLTDGGNVEICELMETVITDNNGEMVPLEDIFECLPNASKIVFKNKTPSIFSLEAAEFKISATLKELTLWISPDNFDLDKFFIYMKKHPQIRYKLWYNGVTFKEFVRIFAPLIGKVFPEWYPEIGNPVLSFLGKKKYANC